MHVGHVFNVPVSDHFKHVENALHEVRQMIPTCSSSYEG